MKFLSLIPYYIVWHYTQAIVNLVAIWGNFIWLLYNFFSIKVLLRTFFAPFKRLSEKGTDGLDVPKFFENLIVNSLMRVIGMIFRSVIIVIGAVSIVSLFLVGMLLLFIWLLLPFLILFLFGAAIYAIFNNHKFPNT